MGPISFVVLNGYNEMSYMDFRAQSGPKRTEETCSSALTWAYEQGDEAPGETCTRDLLLTLAAESELVCLLRLRYKADALATVLRGRTSGNLVLLFKPFCGFGKGFRKRYLFPLYGGFSFRNPAVQADEIASGEEE